MQSQLCSLSRRRKISHSSPGNGDDSHKVHFILFLLAVAWKFHLDNLKTVEPAFLKAPDLSGEEKMGKSLQCLNICLVTAICVGQFDTISLCFDDLSFHGYLEYWGGGITL